VHRNECGTGGGDGEVAVNDVMVRSRVIQGKVSSTTKLNPPRQPKCPRFHVKCIRQTIQ
jgi:hypothetical protein